MKNNNTKTLLVAAQEILEGRQTAKHTYTTKKASVRGIMATVREFSNAEMEDLLFSLAQLQLMGGNADNADQMELGELLYKAATEWKNRRIK